MIRPKQLLAMVFLLAWGCEASRLPTTRADAVQRIRALIGQPLSTPFLRVEAVASKGESVEVRYTYEFVFGNLGITHINTHRQTAVIETRSDAIDLLHAFVDGQRIDDSELSEAYKRSTNWESSTVIDMKTEFRR